MKKSIKYVLFVLSIAIIGTVFTGCKKDENTLNVYNWGDYIAPEVIEEFEEEYGIKVNYSTFDTNEDMYVKVKSGGNSYDVLFPSDYIIEKMIKEDMLLKLDMNNIPNYKNIDEKFKNLDFDPDNEYSVPYMWGTLGIIYNKNAVTDKVESLDILWDKKYSGQILMLNSQRDSIAISLKRLGYSMNSTDKDELQKAKEELIKQKPLVYAYVGDEVKDLMIGEEADIGVVWSGDAVYMMGENENLDYVVPKEGSNLWFDNMVIPSTSKHKKEAELFINFMCRPDIALKNTEYIGYSTPNKETFKLLSEEMKNDDVAYPKDEGLENCEIFNDLGEFTKEYSRIWTEILAQ
ncbi:ABC transporter substrate-binding protein [Sporanaerobacter acetigenes]|uniref:Spermidine/putrescine transport system substrate-binding protein n=1 Tax=Sporanaerobacter acetigenes DSM 13106 TaxID=1123281 RepID=A0A1M5Z5U7_9FIRM|nr:ABC transporter substrate-binding protein [Sporanaerobacter acetigenes]SHI19570.1 spermidine/putrescine transport system substrate-binding protein [Sporanaerobacter acetigenes DSM 13106]